MVNFKINTLKCGNKIRSTLTKYLTVKKRPKNHKNIHENAFKNSIRELFI